MADASVGLSAAQTKVGESADLAAAGTGRMEKAMASATRVSRSGMLGLTETHHALSRVGSEASTMASRFGRAMATMRAEAMKPIRPIIEGARNVGGRVSSMGRSRGGGIGMGGMLMGGGLLAYGAVKAVKSSVESTSQMVIQATAMNKVMGMNTNTALQWVAVAQALGVPSRQLSMGFKTLGTQVEHATAGSKASVTAFKTLGITHAQLAAHSHDLSGMLGLVADHLNKMPGGATKTAIAAQLLGRSYVGLIPILSEGSKGMAEQRKQAAAYGVTLGGNPMQNLRKLHEASINLKLAQTGLQVQLAEHVAPAMIKVFDAGMKVFKVLKDQLGPAFHWISGAVKDATAWFNRHKDAATALKAGLMVVVGAFVLLKGAMIASRIAMLDSPIGWLILGIAALVVAVVYAWNHFKTFRTVVTTVFNAIKAAVGWLGNAFNWLWKNVIHPVWNAIGAVVSSAWNAFLSPTFNAIKAAVDWLGGAFNWLWKNVIKPVWGGISSAVTTAWGIIQPILSTLGDAFTTAFGIVKKVVNAVLGPINAVVGAVNTVGGALSSISPFGGSSSQGQINKASPVGVAALNRQLKSIGAPPVHQTHAHKNFLTRQTLAHTNAIFGGDIVVQIDGREIARANRRQTTKAMAAGA